MALIEHDLFSGRIDKVQIAIDRLRLFEPAEGYYIAYSGGKDSDTILALAKMAGVRFDAHYNLTTVDPPELVWHIKTHPEVAINRPEKTMWQIIAKEKTLPLRQSRFCCRLLKEQSGEGRRVVTGVRWEESPKRAKRQMNEDCYNDPTKHYLNPIIDWTAEDVWQFLKENHVPYCSLYDEGWKRLGCVCCPNANKLAQAERWPKIAAAYLHAVQRYWPEKKDPKHKTPEDYFHWWLTEQEQWDDDDRLFHYED